MDDQLHLPLRRSCSHVRRIVGRTWASLWPGESPVGDFDLDWGPGGAPWWTARQRAWCCRVVRLPNFCCTTYDVVFAQCLAWESLQASSDARLESRHYLQFSGKMMLYYLQLSTSGMRVHHESMLSSHIYGHSWNARSIGSYKKRCIRKNVMWEKKLYET